MKILKTLAIAVLFLSLNSCKSSLNLIADYDVSADFNSYKTFTFLPWAADNSEYVLKPGQDNLYALLETELVAREYKKVETGGELSVNLLVLLDEKTTATAYSRYYSTGSYGYYSSFGYGYSSTTYYKKEDFLQGSIIVDVFDHKAKQLIWQGVAIQEIVENKSKRDRAITSSIKKMFAKFPKEAVK